MVLSTFDKYRTSRLDHLIHYVSSSDAELMMIYICERVYLIIRKRKLETKILVITYVAVAFYLYILLQT